MEGKGKGRAKVWRARGGGGWWWWRARVAEGKAMWARVAEGKVMWARVAEGKVRPACTQRGRAQAVEPGQGSVCKQKGP